MCSSVGTSPLDTSTLAKTTYSMYGDLASFPGLFHLLSRFKDYKAWNSGNQLRRVNEN